MSRWKSRCAWTLLIVIVAILLPAAPASAHGTGQAKPSNYFSALDNFPAPAGVTLNVVNAGDRFQLTNNSPNDIVVLGYNDEPYLRVGPSGTFVNTFSPAYYLNRTTNPTAPAPTDADPTKAPDWLKQASSHTVFWHDHRIHWLSTVPPPQVRAAPGASHVVIPQWTVQFQYNSQTLNATGHLSWIPGPSPLPWYFIAAFCCVVGISFAFIAHGPRHVRYAKLANSTYLSAILLLVVFDALHTAGVAMATAGNFSTRLGIISEAATPSIIAWAVGVYGIWRVRCNAYDGVWFVLFSSAIIAVLGGLTDFADLKSSQIPTLLPHWLARLAVAVSAGLGTGLAVTSLLFIRRQREDLQVDMSEANDVGGVSPHSASVSADIY